MTSPPPPARPPLRPRRPAVSPDAVRRVRESWSLVVPIRDAAAQAFYERLFVIAPEVRPMFRSDRTEQGAKLMAALNTLVLSLDRMEQMLPMARELAIRHAGWGVQPQHYDVVGEALLWTLGQGLGTAATPEVLQAWGEAYAALATAMKEAAWPTPEPASSP